jgi:anti-anti-sigma regulatory factor
VIEISHQTERSSAAVMVVEMKRGSTTELARLLSGSIGAREIDVVVDLGERADASSELLTLLHRCGRHVRSLGGTLSVVCSRPELRRLFDVTLLSQGFPVYASRDEAVRPWA